MKKETLSDIVEDPIAKLMWMTSDEAADYLRISVGALRTHVNRGGIPFYKFKRRLRFKRTDLDRMLEGTRRGGWR